LLLESTVYLILIIIPHECPVNDEIILSMPDIDTVNIIEKAFCKRQVMDSVKNICLPYTVVADKRVYFRREFQLRLLIVFKIDK
jgi:hypothetical protein